MTRPLLSLYRGVGPIERRQRFDSQDRKCPSIRMVLSVAKLCGQLGSPKGTPAFWGEEEPRAIRALPLAAKGDLACGRRRRTGSDTTLERSIGVSGPARQHFRPLTFR